jgi:transcriptional regulator with XRE-family HTH domain
MNAEETAQQRLARRVRQRRMELGLSVRAAAKAAGIDRDTWSKLEDSTRATQDRNYNAIERTLEWPQGEIDSILKQQNVTKIRRPTDDEIRSMSMAQLGAIAAQIEAKEGYENARIFFNEVADVLRMGSPRPS